MKKSELKALVLEQIIKIKENTLKNKLSKEEFEEKYQHLNNIDEIYNLYISNINPKVWDFSQYIPNFKPDNIKIGDFIKFRFAPEFTELVYNIEGNKIFAGDDNIEYNGFNKSMLIKQNIKKR